MRRQFQHLQKDLQGLTGCTCREMVSCTAESRVCNVPLCIILLMPHTRYFIALPHFSHSCKQG